MIWKCVRYVWIVVQLTWYLPHLTPVSDYQNFNLASLHSAPSCPELKALAGFLCPLDGRTNKGINRNIAVASFDAFFFFLFFLYHFFYILKFHQIWSRLPICLSGFMNPGTALLSKRWKHALLKPRATAPPPPPPSPIHPLLRQAKSLIYVASCESTVEKHHSYFDVSSELSLNHFSLTALRS